MFPDIKFKILIGKEQTQAWSVEEKMLFEDFCQQDNVLASTQKLEDWLACVWDEKMRVVESDAVLDDGLEPMAANQATAEVGARLEMLQDAHTPVSEALHTSAMAIESSNECLAVAHGDDANKQLNHGEKLPTQPSAVSSILPETVQMQPSDSEASNGFEPNAVLSVPVPIKIDISQPETACISTIEHPVPLDNVAGMVDAESVVLETSLMHQPSENPFESASVSIFKKSDKPTATQAYRVILPNAKQGEAYAKPLQFEPDVAYVVREIEFSPECGLAWNADTLQCEGVPHLSGDVLVKIWWHPLESEQHEWSQTQIYINADPKSLWKNIPSDAQTLFWKTDEACLGLGGERYDLLAARVRGRSHAHVGSCCDDDFAMARFVINEEYPAYVVTVSDGAGSAAFSRLGSKLAVEAVVQNLTEILQSSNSIQYIQKHLHEELPDSDWQEYVEKVLSPAAYKAFEAHYHASKKHADTISDIKQLSSTLLIGFGITLPNFKTLIGAYWIGDGVVALYQPNVKVDVMGEADSGEFSGQTRFLSKEDVAQDSLIARIQYRVLEGEHALILMTDGVSDPKFDSEHAMSELQPWQVLWHEWKEACRDAKNAPEAAAALQEWLNFFSPGNHDDRTLAIVSAPLYPHNETVAI